MDTACKHVTFASEIGTWLAFNILEINPVAIFDGEGTLLQIVSIPLYPLFTISTNTDPNY